MLFIPLYRFCRQAGTNNEIWTPKMKKKTVSLKARFFSSKPKQTQRRSFSKILHRSNWNQHRTKYQRNISFIRNHVKCLHLIVVIVKIRTAAWKSTHGYESNVNLFLHIFTAHIFRLNTLFFSHYPPYNNRSLDKYWFDDYFYSQFPHCIEVANHYGRFKKHMRN